MTGLRAIETRHAGCHFRSRLEARWAVFFDAMGIEWEYEPEGFELSVGRYLPDFRIRVPDDDYPYWFEVKPPDFRGDDRHRVLCVESATPLIVAAGMPRSYRDQFPAAGRVWPLTVLLWGDRLDGARIPAGAARPEAHPAAFLGAGHTSSPGPCRMWDAVHKARAYGCSTCEQVHVAIATDISGHNHQLPAMSPSVDLAYSAARSARFEGAQ